MITLERIKRTDWRFVGAAFCAAAILHIVMTLMAPELAAAPPYRRLRTMLPVNTMTILPPITFETQPLPFMAPDARYAMCRFDSSKSEIEITATLPGPGWSLALHSKDGENFYTAVAQPGRETDVSLLLIPSDERFTGLTAEAVGRGSEESRSLTLVAPEGLAILRAPDLGQSYRARNEEALARAKCGPKKL